MGKTWFNKCPQTRDYYIFTCRHRVDVEALLQEHTTIIGGRIITFWECHWSIVPQSINFHHACFWVRVVGLPLGYLSNAWPMQALRHVGFIESIPDETMDLPKDPIFRAQMLTDVSKPLIPCCFLPLFDSQVIWVYFRYEGVFRFCKKCGCAGHYTRSCNLSDYEARRRIRVRVANLEQS